MNRFTCLGQLCRLGCHCFAVCSTDWHCFLTELTTHAHSHLAFYFLQGKGEGLVRLGLQYRSLEKFTAEDVTGARKGLLLVGILGAKNLASAKGDDVSSL